jgi:hypothetical protein
MAKPDRNGKIFVNNAVILADAGFWHGFGMLKGEA